MVKENKSQAIIEVYKINKYSKILKELVKVSLKRRKRTFLRTNTGGMGSPSLSPRR
jgi:hypothetical protein